MTRTISMTAAAFVTALALGGAATASDFAAKPVLHGTRTSREHKATALEETYRARYQAPASHARDPAFSPQQDEIYDGRF